MKNKVNILLTGASGAVGLEVLKQLSKLTNEYNITVFDIKNKKNNKLLKPFKACSNVIFGDIAQNNKELQNACKNQDFVIHLAALIPPKADELTELANQINVIGTKNLIQNIEKFSPKAFFIYSSSISVYGDRLKNPWINVNDLLAPSLGDEYAVTKIKAEKIITESQLNWSVFRLSAIMGKHKISKLMFHMPLNTSLEIATPTITATAFLNALKNSEKLSKKIFNLGGGDKFRTTYKEFLSRSFKIYGLGKLNFPEKSFAEKNFHCGFYQDSSVLNTILNFQNGTLNDYYCQVDASTNKIIKFFTFIFSKPIKHFLLRQSEPYFAQKTKNKKLINRFFYVLLVFLFFNLFSNKIFSFYNF